LEYTSLGKTGLLVSVAGLGCGGHSQLGLGTGKSENDAVALVRAAIDLGVNFFDTSEAYATESVLGRAFADLPRDRVVVCTKSRSRDRGGSVQTAAAVVANLEASLRRLGLDHVDVYMLHGLLPAHYDYAQQMILPALIREKEKGKVGHIGLSEFPGMDPEHVSLDRALSEPAWEVIMLGFHMLHQGARAAIFPRTTVQGVGTVVMCAVRNIFSRPDALNEILRKLSEQGEVPASFANGASLEFLIHEGGAVNLTDAAYRFARHEPGVNVVLFGTSSLAHLRANVESLLKPPLPRGDLAKLRERFGHLSGVGLDVPDAVRAELAGMRN